MTELHSKKAGLYRVVSKAGSYCRFLIWYKDQSTMIVTMSKDEAG